MHYWSGPPSPPQKLCFEGTLVVTGICKSMMAVEEVGSEHSNNGTMIINAKVLTLV